MLEFESFRELNGEFLLKPNSGKYVMLFGKKIEWVEVRIKEIEIEER